jgi:hypothetical protein
LRRVFYVYASGYYPFTKIAAVLVSVNAILWVVIFPFLLSTLNVTREDISDPKFILSHTGQFFLLLGPHSGWSILIFHIPEGSMIKAVADIYAGRQPDSVACMKLGIRKALSITVTSPWCPSW